MKEVCWLRGLWRWFRTGFGIPVSGHDFVHVETVEGCTVEVLRCPCGEVSIGWTRR